MTDTHDTHSPGQPPANQLMHAAAPGPADYSESGNNTTADATSSLWQQVQQVFAPNGVLAQARADYRPRADQMRMARQAGVAGHEAVQGILG